MPPHAPEPSFPLPCVALAGSRSGGATWLKRRETLWIWLAQSNPFRMQLGRDLPGLDAAGDAFGARRLARSQALSPLLGIDRAGLMWEWLRRDPDYIAWYARASAVTRGSGDDGTCDPATWGCTFAEDPDLTAPDARLIWHAGLDPGTLAVEAVAASPHDPDAIDPAELGAWLTLAADAHGREHAVISDGWHRIRPDVLLGTLSKGPVVLNCGIAAGRSALPKLLPLKRLVDFALHRRFARALYPADPRVARWLTALQVQDGLVDGASHREIAEALYGTERVESDWEGRSDSLRSRVRRLVAEAKRLSRGGYRLMMRQGARPPPPGPE